MTVYCITQARMGSARLAGKVLKTVQGVALIDYHLARVKSSKLIDKHIVAIPNTVIDQPLKEHLEGEQQSFFCGDEQDVLGRFFNAAANAGAQPEDLIVRLTADCPLSCSSLIDEAIAEQLRGSILQYTHISLNDYPRGFDVEVFSMHSLTQANKLATTAFDREHVTPFFYNNPDKYNISSVTNGKKEWSLLRLCIDEPADFELFESLIVKFASSVLSLKAPEICELLLENPQLVKLNSKVSQKS